jgi:hypothetical protein
MLVLCTAIPRAVIGASTLSRAAFIAWDRRRGSRSGCDAHRLSTGRFNQNGERLIWLEPNVVDRLRTLRGRGEDYSDVILRLASEGG